MQIIQGCRLRSILCCYFVAFVVVAMTESKGQMMSSNAASSTVMEPQSASFSPSAPSSSGQSNFRRISCTEDNSPYPIPGLAADILHMRVKEGSKIRNLLRFVTVRMQAEGREGNGTSPRQVVFTGSGRGVTKTITCVEILKRNMGGLHQVSKLFYKTVNEVLESPQPGAPGTTKQRTVPAICILLSKDPLDPKEPGYQAPQSLCVSTEDVERRRALFRTPHRPSSQPTAKRLCLDDWGVCSP